MEDVQYTQYYVAFLDILGFKNLINGSDTSCQDILRIYNSFGIIHKIFYGEKIKSKETVRMKIMSDSICVYIEANIPNALYSLISFCIGFQYDLLVLSPNIFIRGGITLGNMYAKDDIMFGPALTEAYLLEEKNAKFPRIIMRKCTLDSGAAQSDEQTKRLLYGGTYRDFDAFYALNYYVLFQGKVKEAERISNIISKWLDTTIDESIRKKYLYTEKHIRKYLKEKSDA